MKLSEKKVTEVNVAAKAAALDIIRAQAARGIGREMPQKRTAFIVSRVLAEMLASFPVPAPKEGEETWDENEWQARIMQAALFTGPLMQGSTLQKYATDEGVYAKAAGLGEEYE
jgi:hypothetical protein